MANEQNLIPVRTGSEARERGRAGGIASGEARRERKRMREWAELIGSLPTPVVCPDGTKLDDGDLDADLVMAQYRAAHKGSTKAATFIAKLKGEIIDRSEVDADVRSSFPDLPDIEAAKKYLLELNRK